MAKTLRALAAALCALAPSLAEAACGDYLHVKGKPASHQAVSGSMTATSPHRIAKSGQLPGETTAME